MQISSTRLSKPSRHKTKVAHASGSEVPENKDSVTFRYRSRAEKRRLMKGGAILVGAGMGSLATAHFTSQLTGTAAKVFGGVGGGIVGATALGLAGIAVAAKLDDSPGFGGLASAFAGFVVGSVVGGAAGAVGGSMLANGAGNVLGYAGGALLGGTVAGFAAKGALD